MSTSKSGVVYDAQAVHRALHYPCPMEQAPPGEVIVYYGGWSLDQLARTPPGKLSIFPLMGFDQLASIAERGYYRLMLPMPWTSELDAETQRLQISFVYGPDWTPVPVAVAVTALLIHVSVTGRDLLEGTWCRCGETLSGGSRVTLRVARGRIRLCSLEGRVAMKHLLMGAACRC